ncbi:ABC transporter ATP-binding protein [Chenggangzhangella methanolivorans]|uniref:Dipeptide/oligopeptide/nickel ABC transporter ATP-binding protein n=1 Tax=Chenggangzhangella methanolivorans TaxID=1437009 RepID=A0A9E6ULU2_9HYPH|nr:dipeptide/oligopeptide/nickel ABC transporter ATP-binding protein [Chenggangzhangella methanolivorans]QZO00932.1 dipeptide/oligopeptide/nickel ABC transporter ATP-binding protein [Chenggangzhangella methanolivorans]
MAGIEVAALAAQDVAKRYGGRAALDGVSVSVARGEALGVVGESGSGKSTLARVMVGLLAPDEGAVAASGETFDPKTARGRAALRRRAQFVFQDAASAFNPRRTIGQSLEAPLIGLTRLGRADRRRRTAETLELVGLRAEHAERHPHEFSGGQLQRAGIARALIAEPDVVALDEPVSALDVSVQAQILALLKRLRAERGLTMIFVSHDLAVVETLCDRIAVIKAGRIVEEGACRETLARPREDYTRALVAAAAGGHG